MGFKLMHRLDGWWRYIFYTNLKTSISCLSSMTLSLDILDRSNQRRERFEEFKMKLDEYQQATGINDTTRDQIWSKTIPNGKLLVHYRIKYTDVSQLNRKSLRTWKNLFFPTVEDLNIKLSRQRHKPSIKEQLWRRANDGSLWNWRKFERDRITGSFRQGIFQFQYDV